MKRNWNPHHFYGGRHLEYGRPPSPHSSPSPVFPTFTGCNSKHYVFSYIFLEVTIAGREEKVHNEILGRFF